MDLDKLGLKDDSVPILKRLETFIEETEKLGLNIQAINEGTLNEHILSNAFEIQPTLVRMYFNLYLCDEDELQYLADKKFHTSLLNTLMFIHPVIRKEVYKHIEKLLKDEYPINRIIEFINYGNWRIRIHNIYEKVEKDYWAAVSSFLKDTSTKSGTITISFRSMLMSIRKSEASVKQLDWLERGIIHDYEQKLNVFINDSMKTNHPDAVRWIKKFIDDYVMFELYHNNQG